MTKKRIRITDGGIALPLGNNTFLMRGRLHSQGGIGIGNGGKNDIEVEDGEIVKFNKNNIQVLSDQPMLNGISPANALLAGGSFNKIFKAQQSINGNYGGSYAETGTEKKYNYIGGTPQEARKKYLEFDTDLTNAINAIANEYGINNELLMHRVAKEGLIDRLIQENNANYKNKDYKFSSAINFKEFYPFDDLGLDDSFDLYDKYNLHRNIPIRKIQNYNEKERVVNSVITKNVTDGIELMAADLNYRKELLKNKGFNPTNAMISGSYNRGVKGLLDMYNNDKNSVETEYKIPDTYKELINKDIKYTPDIEIKTNNYKGLINDDANYIAYIAYKHGYIPLKKEDFYDIGKEELLSDYKGLSDKEKEDLLNKYDKAFKDRKEDDFIKNYTLKYGLDIRKDINNDKNIIPLLNKTYNFKNGGQINMKLKYKNKQDITDIVMNEILPHSTGERKKFFTGGFWTNLAANGVNSLLQGIISPILNYNMANEIEKSGKDLQPAQMSKTYLDSRDHTLKHLLGDVDRTVNKFIDISSKNTNNSKTHMNRVRGFLSDAITKKQDIIGRSLNRSDDIKSKNAIMAQEVDKINIANKNQFALVNEQNRIARQAAAMSARTAGNQAILDSTKNLLQGIGKGFYDHDKLGLSLLNSNNSKAWDFFDKHWGQNWK